MKKILILVFIVSNLLFARELKIGSENAYAPFAYLDENNQATGFDNEVVKILSSYLPDVKLTFVSVPWNAIFSGLDGAKFDIIANQISKTKEREEKYLFSAKPYFYGVSALILSKNGSAKHIDELKGKKIGVSIGSNHAFNLEKYAKDHPELNLKIVHYKTSPTLIADLANSRLDAIVNDPIASLDYAKAQGVAIKVTEFYFEKVPVFLVFRKNSLALKQELDVALEKALQDGKISELSQRYFGLDLSR
ncbi:transporter substrate-binding domain-containing protein [Campylobacter sp. MIT 97-5078]|uniref:transporter substrate-binding domain-containing protein n=1 Tax=Campylobacter sp. MIT 97-5078 TaxID=1548153 RepID=UPI0006911DFD|nr:transporter substrate-binding domain-containing protein [Campylobacter sp. MIT 97-5078]TQR26720.1 L-cystine-binding protein tcyA [Campylobacter sp. MIT 97-5078]